LALLTAFADRVGRVDAQKGAREVQLAGGQRLAVGRPPIGFGAGGTQWLVALDAEERRDGTQQRLRLQSFAAVPQSALLDAPLCEMDSRTEWIDEGQRIAVIDEVRYGALLLDQERRLFAAGAAPPEASAALGRAIAERRNVLAALVDPEALVRMQQRIAVAGTTAPGLVATLGPFDVASLLVEFAPGCSAVREVKDLDLLARWLDRLSGDERRRFELLAPDRLRLHAGRTAQIEYPVGAEPYVASRLQDFFGQSSVPLVGGQPLTVHLLAPNGRPLQVTRDLPSFWRNQYPELRNALCRRYPRHAWPDDPLAAAPSAPTPRRRS
jgi:ATP-dependent helicase HrpB